MLCAFIGLEGKRHRAAALQNLAEILWLLWFAKRLGVRQPYAALWEWIMFIGLKCRDCGWGECYPHEARCSAHGASSPHRFPHFLGCTEDSIQSAVGGLDVPFLAFPAVVFPPITGAQKWAANIGNDSIKNSAANQRRVMLTGF